jgi:predicted RNase H-like HicB family nuclease
MHYAIVIEQSEHNYSAYAPDVPGCVATGATLEEVTAMMRDALEFHFHGLAEDGDPIPAAVSRVATVEVALPADAQLTIADVAD